MCLYRNVVEKSGVMTRPEARMPSYDALRKLTLLETEQALAAALPATLYPLVRLHACKHWGALQLIN